MMQLSNEDYNDIVKKLQYGLDMILPLDRSPPDICGAYTNISYALGKLTKFSIFNKKENDPTSVQS